MLSLFKLLCKLSEDEEINDPIQSNTYIVLSNLMFSHDHRTMVAACRPIIVRWLQLISYDQSWQIADSHRLSYDGRTMVVQ